MVNQYRQLDHGADLSIEVMGRTLEELFENSASALYDIMFTQQGGLAEKSMEISVTGIDTEDLLIRWLNELLFITDMDEMVFSEFQVLQMEKNHLIARVSGERFKPDKHGGYCPVKAATYHNIQIQEIEDGLTVAIVFDV